MCPQQMHALERLGIDTDKNSIDIFEDLLNIALFLFEETEKNEEDRFREALYKHRKATN